MFKLSQTWSNEWHNGEGFFKLIAMNISTITITISIETST